VNDRISVVMITHNRSLEARTAVERMRHLAERPHIIVVDNGSTDDTVARLHGLAGVSVVPVGANLGTQARNVGLRLAGTEYVALCDDDCSWCPGSLAAAVEHLDRAPRLAVATAQVLIEPDGREDPTCSTMSVSPLPRAPDLPGIPVLGFLAGACVVRRSALLSVGGFEPRYFLGGEEEVLAVDLVTAGWGLAYLPALTVRHAPSPHRDRPGRARLSLRNALWSTWLRRPLRDAVLHSVRLVASAPRNGRSAACWDALGGLGWVARNRRVVPPDVARMLRLLDTAGSAR
jgi:GT2 family glycosyltransferase